MYEELIEATSSGAHRSLHSLTKLNKIAVKRPASSAKASDHLPMAADIWYLLLGVFLLLREKEGKERRKREKKKREKEEKERRRRRE